MKAVTLTMAATMLALAGPTLASDADDRYERGGGAGIHDVRDGDGGFVGRLLHYVRDDDDDDDDDRRRGRGRGRDDWDDRRDRVQDGWLSIAEISTKMSEGGLKVHKIEADDGRYEVYATDADGKWVKAYVNPTTGEIMHRRERSR